MARKSKSKKEKIKYFFKEYSAILAGSSILLGFTYGIGIWTGNINNAIKQNEITLQYNKEILQLKQQYDEKIKLLEKENDELRHNYRILEYNINRLENETKQKNK